MGSPSEAGQEDGSAAGSALSPALLFLGLVVALAALRLAKAHSAGVIYDEVLTVSRFAHSPAAALGDYPIPNNHLLNSLAIHYAGFAFPGYAHFLRVPSMVMSAVFTLALMPWPAKMS